jgi:hypothetical protein
MAFCVNCFEPYSDKRLSRGYHTCLECGDENAKNELVRKSKCTAPAFNKGAYTYVATTFQAKEIGK